MQRCGRCFRVFSAPTREQACPASRHPQIRTETGIACRHHVSVHAPRCSFSSACLSISCMAFSVFSCASACLSACVCVRVFTAILAQAFGWLAAPIPQSRLRRSTGSSQVDWARSAGRMTGATKKKARIGKDKQDVQQTVTSVAPVPSDENSIAQGVARIATRAQRRRGW